MIVNKSTARENWKKGLHSTDLKSNETYKIYSIVIFINNLYLLYNGTASLMLL
jgi:hypothetical protein